MSERYALHTRDTRGRWHRRRGSFDTAAAALDAAATIEDWRIVDADGHIIADHLGSRIIAASYFTSAKTCGGRDV